VTAFKGFFLAVAALALLLSTAAWIGISRANTKQQACRQRGGVPVNTGRALSDWVCLDPKVLK